MYVSTGPEVWPCRDCGHAHAPSRRRLEGRKRFVVAGTDSSRPDRRRQGFSDGRWPARTLSFGVR